MFFKKIIIYHIHIFTLLTSYCAEITPHVLIKSHSTSQVPTGCYEGSVKAQPFLTRIRNSLRLKKITPITQLPIDNNSFCEETTEEYANNNTSIVEFSLPGSTNSSVIDPTTLKTITLNTALITLSYQTSLVLQDLNEALDETPSNSPSPEILTSLFVLRNHFEQGHTKCQSTIEKLTPPQKSKIRKSFSWHSFRKTRQEGE